MNICRCPVCGSESHFFRDSSNDEIKIYCPTCKERGVTVEVTGKDSEIENLILKWNTRPIHNLFIKDNEYLHKFLQFEKNSLDNNFKKRLSFICSFVM